MAKITVYSCDFNPNLPQHEAHFMLIVKDTKESGDLATTQLDVCVNHVGQMMESALFSPDRMNEVACKRLSGVAQLPARGRSKVNTHRKVTCPECGKEMHKGNLTRHAETAHNMTGDEIRAKLASH